MLTESGSGKLAGNAHQEAFDQVAKADSPRRRKGTSRHVPPDGKPQFI